jgi:hypothetical protein
MCGYNFTDVNGACMPNSLATTRATKKFLELRMRIWLAGVPVPSLVL